MATVITPPDAPQPSPDAKHAAVTAKQAALIAAIAAVLAAALSFGASWLSASLAAEATQEGANTARDAQFETLRQQLAGESKKSQTEFLRGQRQVLYAKVLAHQVVVVDSQKKLNQLAYLSDTDPDYMAAEKVEMKALSTLNKDMFEIQVIGTDDTVKRFVALEQAEQEHEGAIAEVARNCSGDGVTKECVKARDEKDSANDKVDATFQTLLASFRVDLGAK